MTNKNHKPKSMKHLRQVVLIFFCLAAIGASAQETNSATFTLPQAIEYATKNSPNYLNAALDQQTAEYKKKEITAAGLPQVNGSIDIKDFVVIPTTLLPAAFAGGAPGQFIPLKFGTQYQSTAGFSASQILFSNDYIFALKAQREYLNLSRINVNRSKAELASQVSKAYYSVLINRDRVKLLDANIKRLGKMYEDTKSLNSQGFTEQIDVERLEVQFNNLVSEMDKTQKLIGLSETMLKFQMGYDLKQPIILADSLSAFESDFQELNTSNIDISQRPEYQLLVSQQKLYELDAKRLKWGYLPTLAAYGSYQWTSNRNNPDFLTSDNNVPTKMWFKTVLIGATLNVNIFDGFARHNKIKQAEITAMKNQNTLKNMELGAQLEATMASITYANAFSTLKMQKKNMELANHVVEVAQKKYEAGVGSNLEVTNAETSLKEAQTNYYNAVFDMIVAKLDYQKATGTLK